MRRRAGWCGAEKREGAQDHALGIEKERGLRGISQASEIMRRGEKIPRRQQAGLVIALSVPAILEQLVSTLMSYIDTAMVGSLGYFATASIGVVASTTWLLSGLVSAAAVGFSVQVAQYLGGRGGSETAGMCCARQFYLTRPLARRWRCWLFWRGNFAGGPGR